MAQVFGEPGRNATDESYKRFLKFVLVALITIASLCFLEGYLLSALAPIKGLPSGWIILIDVLLVVLIALIGKWGSGKMRVLDRSRMTWRKGAVGEVLVAGILEDLPAEYIVINDVTQRLGNIDHIVIGPTGVFVIDTKNWRGTVSADGKGELLVNGKPTDKSEVKNLVRSTMDFHDKLKALTEKEYFVKGLMVFPIAYVGAQFGSTSYIHCLRDDNVVNYIVDKTFSKPLAAEDIERIKRAALQLAGMDNGFNVKGSPDHSSHTSAGSKKISVGAHH